VKRQPVHRRLLGHRVLRLGYRAAAAGAHAWWAVRGSRNRGAKCVLFNGGKVLLVRHTYGDRSAWDYPGGFVRRTEDPRAAALRELGEELGVDPPELSAAGSLIVEIGRRSDTVFYFHGELADRRLAPDDVELAEVGWFDPRALPKQLGEHVAQVLAPFTDRGSTPTQIPTRPPIAGDRGGDRVPIAGDRGGDRVADGGDGGGDRTPRSGRSSPEPIASLETDPGSPARG
jgi:ADP-ribose pyrophosphatase YjhB (NUDIX family)